MLTRFRAADARRGFAPKLRPVRVPNVARALILVRMVAQHAALIRPFTMQQFTIYLPRSRKAT